MSHASTAVFKFRSEDDMPVDWEEKVQEDPKVIDLPGLGERAPEDPKDQLPADDPTLEIPTKDPSPDTTPS